MIRFFAFGGMMLFGFAACATSTTVEPSPSGDGGAAKDAAAEGSSFAADSGASSDAGAVDDSSSSGKADANDAAACTIDGTPTCVACLQNHCCAELSACLSEPDCVAINTCEDNCGHTTTCTTNCMNAHPTGKPLAQAFVDCASSQCATECQ